MRTLAPSLALLCAAAAACGNGGGHGGERPPGVDRPRVASEPPAPPACRNALAVVTYNIRRGKPTDGDNNWEFRKAQVGDLLRGLDADVIGLQEVLALQVDDLEAMLPAYRREGVGRDDGERAGEFSPIYYRADRFGREDGGTFWLSPTPDRPRGPDEEKPWGTELNRIATWLILVDRPTGRRLLALSTHFDNKSAEGKAESARVIVQFIARQKVDHVVLVGDLNDQWESEPLRILTDHLTDAVTAPKVSLSRLKTTVTDWTNLKEPGRHIDHILVSRDVRPLDYEVIDRRVTYSGAERYPSDHLPVRAHLCLDR